MEIKKVEIKKFRNLADISFDVNGSVAFSGNNRIGKTNTLNAIMWCLTGYDVNNSADQLSFVPYDLRESSVVGDVLIDVTITFDSWKINRQVVKGKKNAETIISIDDIPVATMKEADVLIDEKLGILSLSFRQSKDFNVRRFLLNPLYITQCKSIAFRKFFISCIKDGINVEEMFKGFGKSKTAKQILSILLVKYNYSISNVSSYIDSNLKKDKEDKERYLTTLQVLKCLSNCETTKPIKAVTKLYEEALKRFNESTETSVALDNFVMFLNKEYKKIVEKKFKGIKVCLLEKGVGEDVWKEVCYPVVDQTDFAIQQGSTSEKIITGCVFTQRFLEGLGLEINIPILFDEAETLDNKSLKELQSKVTRQMLTARVESKDNNAIKAEGVF